MKKRQETIKIDQATHEAMNEYAALYGLSLSDLVNRMWALWSRIEEVRAILPTFPLLQENLDAFLAEMETQADTLDEDYINLDREDEATKARNAAIRAYQEAHPFEPDSDDSPATCPSCKRETTKAGLVYLPGDEIKCTYCYTLPRVLADYEARYGSE